MIKHTENNIKYEIYDNYALNTATLTVWRNGVKYTSIQRIHNVLSPNQILYCFEDKYAHELRDLLEHIVRTVENSDK